MSSEEAREHFSEAFEGDLEGERQAAFQAALAEDEELAADYEGFVETFQLMGRLGEPEMVQAPNLLPRIQERIRRRSRGRYYRDRFSRRSSSAGWTMSLIASVALILVLGLAWYAMHGVLLEEETVSSTEAPTPDE